MPWRENEGKVNKVKGSTPEDRFFCSTTDRTDWLADTGCKTKTAKTPCGWCKMSLTSHLCCARLKSPQASLDIFSQSHHHPFRSLHPSQGDKQGQTHVLWRTALQTAECYVMHMSCTYSIRGLPHARQNGLFLFIALVRMVTFCKEGDGVILVWALRACSYKTKAEA